jgi:NADPH:quinone reductase-like Zn-dependent oxidoreductase
MDSLGLTFFIDTESTPLFHESNGYNVSLAVRFERIGGPEVLHLEEVETRAPEKGEVRIRARALGVNRAEIMFRTRTYVYEPVFPSGIGYEVAGEIESVGPQVEGLSVGDAVSVVPSFAMTDYPVHGELVLAPAHAVVKHPETLSWEEAAAVWMAYVTAYGALIDVGGLQAGETVLISGASSSVGLAAIQIARSIGARPIALTRTGAKRQQLLDAGADAVVATEEEDTVARVNELTDGQGARLVFDPVVGPAVADLAAATAPQGMIILYGALSTEPAPLPLLQVLLKHLTIRGYELFELTMDDQRRAAAVEFILDGLRRGVLTPVVDRVFPLEEIVEAHRYMADGAQVGKIVLRVSR